MGVMKTKRTTLVATTPNWLTSGGIFTALGSLTKPMPWHSSVESLVLDIDYYGAFSGDKPIGPLPSKLLTSAGLLTNTEYVILAKVISSRYLVNWEKLWDTLSFEYNPIHNYSMKEHEDYLGDVDDTKNLSYTTDETEYPLTTRTETRNLAASRNSTRTPNLSHTETKNLADSETRNLTGSDDSLTTYNSTETETQNLTDTKTNALTRLETRNLAGTNDTDTTYGRIETETHNLSQSGSSTETPNTTVTDTTTNMITNTTSSNGRHGFNSSTDGVPVAFSEGDNTVNGSVSRQTTGTVGTITSNSDTGTLTTGYTGLDKVENDTTDTGTVNVSDTGTVTTTNTGTDAIAKTGTDKVERDITDTGTVITTHTGTDTIQETGTEQVVDGTSDTGTVTVGVTGTNTIDRDSTETGTDNRDISYDRDVTRDGNIGATTTQQMISEERQLWLWNFFHQVYRDVDSIMCSALYI